MYLFIFILEIAFVWMINVALATKPTSIDGWKAV